jgi:hypothetical protein
MISPFVTLPKDCLPQFPNRCVVCDANCPDDAIQITIVPATFWTLIFGRLARRFRRVLSIPICWGCRQTWRSNELLYQLYAIATLAMAVIVASPALANQLGPEMRIIAIAAVLAPVSVWCIIRHRPVEVCSHFGGIDYRFQGSQFYAEFCQHNLDRDAVRRIR